MADDAAELLRFAAEYADQSIDLYQLLNVDALTPKEDIRRAWRKESLKYHPDKAGDRFDPAQWELFERARDVLSDAAARAAYDSGMKAKLLRRQEREAMDHERKKFVDDLERREDAARKVREDKSARDREALAKERERLAEEGKLREEESRRREEAEQEVQDMKEARRRLKEKKEEKARRKQAKETMRGSGVSKPTGPANGVVNVPGDYMVGIDGEGKKYWELVCEKLRAVQGVRNIQKGHAAQDTMGEAETKVYEARRRIQEAEIQYQKEATAL